MPQQSSTSSQSVMAIWRLGEVLEIIQANHLISLCFPINDYDSQSLMLLVVSNCDAQRQMGLNASDVAGGETNYWWKHNNIVEKPIHAYSPPQVLEHEKEVTTRINKIITAARNEEVGLYECEDIAWMFQMQFDHLGSWLRYVHGGTRPWATGGREHSHRYSCKGWSIGKAIREFNVIDFWPYRWRLTPTLRGFSTISTVIWASARSKAYYYYYFYLLLFY